MSPWIQSNCLQAARLMQFSINYELGGRIDIIMNYDVWNLILNIGLTSCEIVKIHHITWLNLKKNSIKKNERKRHDFFVKGVKIILQHSNGKLLSLNRRLNYTRTIKFLKLFHQKFFSRDFHEIAYNRFPISISISFSASFGNRLFQIISNV